MFRVVETQLTDTHENPAPKSRLRKTKLRQALLPREDVVFLLEEWYPNPVVLHTLILDIKNNRAREFAGIIGTTDFAEARLAGLRAALTELNEKILAPETKVKKEAVLEIIAEDTRIDFEFEDLVKKCALFTLYGAKK